MSCVRQAFISGAEFGRANGYAYCFVSESERYVSGGRGGWDKQEGTEIELEGLKEAFVSGAEFGRSNGYACCLETEAEHYVNGTNGW